MRDQPIARRRLAAIAGDVQRAIIRNRVTLGAAAALALVLGVLTLLEISYRQELAEDTTVIFTGTIPGSPPDRQLDLQLASPQWAPLSPPGVLLAEPSSVVSNMAPQTSHASALPVPVPRPRPRR